MLEIKTGEQAISFFAKHGSNTPIKFLNCNRAPTSLDCFRPYDLVVVKEKQLEEDYYTISALGVVHVCSNKGKGNKHDPSFEPIPTEFFSLADWMQQATIFNILSSMKFFKHYLIGKVFNLWKGNVRYKMFTKTRAQLAKSLIYSKPAFLGSFMDVNEKLLEMQSHKTFTIPKPNKSYDLDDFYKDQKQDREQVKTIYTGLVEEIISFIDGLIKQVTDSKNLREEEEFEHAKSG